MQSPTSEYKDTFLLTYILNLTQTQIALDQLQTNLSAGNSVLPISQEPQPTPGASSLVLHHDLVREIISSHDPCDRLSHLPEKEVHINSQNPKEYFVITMAKADAWARAIVSTLVYLLVFN